MRVTIYQPRYFPQIHYFHRILHSDTYVFFDTAQFTRSISINTPEGKKNETTYQSETPIKLSSGKHILTIPIKHNGHLPFNKVGIDYSHNWIRQHIGTLNIAFRNAPRFSELHPTIIKLLEYRYESLSEFTLTTILWGISELMEFNLPLKELSVDNVNKQLSKTKHIKLKKIVLASNLNVPRPEGIQKGTEWTTAICIKVRATECYYGKTGATNYMDLDYYKRYGVMPIVQNFVCREYPQQFSKRLPFLANLSVLDLLYNVTSDKAREILEINQK